MRRQRPQRSVPSGMASAQVRQRWLGAAKRASQAVQTGCAGQARHTSQRAGAALAMPRASCAHMRLNILPGSVSTRPPTLDPIAAARWARAAPPRSPWLHEEVARRMAERLE